MAKKKVETKKEFDFPAESCGSCHYCRPMDEEDVREQQGACFALPPVVIADIGSARPLVDWDSFPCKYFRLRAHA